MLLLSDLVPGNWYIAVVCACGERLIVFLDLSEGQGTLDGSYTVYCSQCGTNGTYPAEHYHHQPSNSKTDLLFREQ
jgi:hypothetical protein